ncbi:MAG: hypothetical protein E7420_05130 [Ruminococcaceae bacterium]|nr:hypothetical protein [Oscillospiraceae bacterium]
MLKKIISFAAASAMALTLCACAQEDGGIAVQRADSLAGAAHAGERYAAMVVSENVTEIKRDSTKTVEELFVAVGDTVKTGDKLFNYDLEALELDLEKQRLEIEKMKNELGGYKEQLEKLEKQLQRTYNEVDKSRITLEINTLKTSILEIDYQMIAKENSIADIEETLQNVDVVSPVDGTIRAINEEEGAQSYITIQQEGAYRIKGSLNEMNLNSGIMPGVKVRAYSRVEKGLYWEGTVASIDTDQPSENQNNYWYGPSDPMTESSNYVFYVTPESTEGLLLGQHLYVEMAPAVDKEGLWIPENFFASFDCDEVGNMVATLYVADANGKLVLRSVILGMYDSMDLTYEVLEGVSAEDYIADPSDSTCVEGAQVSYRNVSDFAGSAEDIA